MQGNELVVCPLGNVPSNASGHIVSLDGGRGFVSRLAALGFVPGAHFSMVQNFGRGPLIVLVCQARVALGRNEAERIMVREENVA
jgi:ferrous iron transport protein A